MKDYIKVLLAIWIGITALLALTAYVQSNRLASAVAERDSIRLQTLTVLLTQAEETLEEAADQVEGRNLGTAQASTGAALSLLEAAGSVADIGLSTQIAPIADRVTNIRGEIIQGDEMRKASGDLRREASTLRAFREELVPVSTD